MVTIDCAFFGHSITLEQNYFAGNISDGRRYWNNSYFPKIVNHRIASDYQNWSLFMWRFEFDNTIPTIMQNKVSSKEARQNWARLIQKIYEVDPLVCPKCQGQMKLVSFVENLDVLYESLTNVLRRLSIFVVGGSWLDNQSGPWPL